MAEKRYYYRFGLTSGLGIRFRGFWNKCKRANMAADKFAKKVGARMFYPDMKMVAGGVDAVVFPEGAKVDGRIWRSAGKDGDGLELWVPDVKKRRGVYTSQEGEKVPAHTASRIFDKKAMDDGGKHWGYTELYRDDEEARAGDKRYKLNRAAKESIRIEKERLLLPRVSAAELLMVLTADVTADVPKDDAMHAVRIYTPDMFEWKGFYYLSIDYPCRDEDMEAIKMEEYRLANTERAATERALKELEGMKGD